MGNSSSIENFLLCNVSDEKGERKSGYNSIARCIADVESDDEGGFDDVYEIDWNKTLGTGKFSVVRLCWRRSTPEKKFAVKLIDTLVAASASMARIQSEISILQVLGGHPGLVELIEADNSASDAIRLVMELCVGGELYDRIRKLTHYSEREARSCVYNLLDAVAYIHCKGIMHRDLKPENILLVSMSSNTDIKISDFGLAKMSHNYPMKLPRATSICGSDFYLAPELIQQQEYGREVDIWAIGVITYILLSGALPFYSTVLHKLYRQIVERDMGFSEAPWLHVSKGAQDFILRLLQVRPGDRLSAESALSHPWISGDHRGA
eukprot:TRINITY_DN14765_c0_g1_i1.p1 TRINITY_DN14765_c0_g1~~TRINITY_DN14765_c0_g1_i1.p1  ORF type:complete len:322 (-),score=43.52 TRINITY_DN14765_c0_g1_i1:165-1130(-)